MVQMDGGSPKPLLGRLRLFGITKVHLRVCCAMWALLLVFGCWCYFLKDSRSVFHTAVPLETLEVLSILQQIYGSGQVHHGDALGVSERALMGEAAVYGEILPESVGLLFAKIGGLDEDDFFVDLGSGTGKICLQAHLSTLVRKVLGVELGKQRHLRAIQAQDALGTLGRRDFRRSLEFVQEDALQVFHLWRSASVIFMNSLRFPRALMCSLVDMFLKMAPGSLVISSKPLPGCHRCCRLLDSIRLQASWHDTVKIHIYAVPPPPSPYMGDLQFVATATSLRDILVNRGLVYTWPERILKNPHRAAVLGNTTAVEWGLAPLLGEEFSLASCELSDIYECSVEPEAGPLDIAKLPPGGTILPSGMDKLLKFAKLSDGSLVVVGSGEGNFPLYAALATDTKSILGLELVVERHRRAELALNAIQQRRLLKEHTSVHFESVNMARYDQFHEWQHASIVVLVSAFWQPEELAHLQSPLESLPPCSRVFSLQPLPGCHPGFVVQERVEGVSVSWNAGGTDMWYYLRDARKAFVLAHDGTVAHSEGHGSLSCGAEAHSMLPVQVAQCILADAAAAAPPPPDGCGIWSSKVLQDSIVSFLGQLLPRSAVLFIGPGWYVAMFLLSMLRPVDVSLWYAPKEEVIVARALHQHLSIKKVLDIQRPISMEQSEDVVTFDNAQALFINARWALEASWTAPSNVSVVVCCDGDASSWLAMRGDTKAREVEVELTCARDEGDDISRRRATIYIHTEPPNAKLSGNGEE